MNPDEQSIEMLEKHTNEIVRLFKVAIRAVKSDTNADDGAQHMVIESLMQDVMGVRGLVEAMKATVEIQERVRRQAENRDGLAAVLGSIGDVTGSW